MVTFIFKKFLKIVIFMENSKIATKILMQIMSLTITKVLVGALFRQTA